MSGTQQTELAGRHVGLHKLPFSFGNFFFPPASKNQANMADAVRVGRDEGERRLSKRVVKCALGSPWPLSPGGVRVGGGTVVIQSR